MVRNFSFTLGSSLTHNTEGFEFIKMDGALYWHYGLSVNELGSVCSLVDPHKIGALLQDVISDFFCLFVYDLNSKELHCFNDRSGHNEIYVSKDKKTGECLVRADITDVELLDPDAVHEYLIFHSVLPPKTMYVGVETVPMASFVSLSTSLSDFEYVRYWNIEETFAPKTGDYLKVVNDLRDSCVEDVEKKRAGVTGVALSGGIDSGGILGMLSESEADPVPSISFGPHGPGSDDLKSARKTAEHFASKQTELYPTDSSFEYLFSVLPKLSHPIPPDILLPLCHIFDEANKRKIDTLFFGYGVQANLGNLMFNKMWHWLWIIESCPDLVRNTLYRAVAKARGFSENQKAILLSRNWIKRFLYNQGALYTREKQIYKKMDESFLGKMEEIYQPTMDRTELKLSDRFVLMYILGWTHHTQERDTPMISKHFEVGYCCPYNSKKPLEILFKATDKIRKKNRWKKQVWRDALRPFIPDHLYTRKGKSLVVPYSKIFKDELDRFLPYLRSHKMLSEYVDFEIYEKEFSTLPEPGLNLFRLVSLGIWFDSRHDENQLKVIKEIMLKK